MKKLLMLFVLTANSLAHAGWDGIVTGTIAKLDITGGDNYGFRVYLDGSPKLCNNDHGWAYLNEADSNYQVYVSALLTAKAAGSKVTLYAKWEDQKPSDYCHIKYMTLY